MQLQLNRKGLRPSAKDSAICGRTIYKIYAWAVFDLYLGNILYLLLRKPSQHMITIKVACCFTLKKKTAYKHDI